MQSAARSMALYAGWNTWQPMRAEKKSWFRVVGERKQGSSIARQVGVELPVCDVAVLTELRLACVQAHPYLYLDPSTPLVRGQLSLSVGRGGHSRTGRLERGEERIALRVDDPAVVCSDRGAKKTPVVGEDLVVAVAAQPLEQRRRPLDVREEKGDRAGGQILHDAQLSSITPGGQSAPGQP